MKKLLENRMFLPILVYLITLAIVLHYNLTHGLVNDGVWEYRTYMLNISEGEWRYRTDSLNSCLVPFWIPSLLQRWTDWDAMMLFRVFPAFFYALMPSFAYLIAKRYLNRWDSLTAALVIIFSSYILFFPDVGRVGIVLGFMSVMIWALLEKKLVHAIIFAVLVVFSHYGTAVIAICAAGSVLGGILLWNLARLKPHCTTVKPYLVVLCVLLVLTGAWHFGIARYSGDVMWSAVFRQEELKLDLEKYTVLDLKGKDDLAQTAFGKDFATNPVPLKIEIIVNWLVVAFITLGIYSALKSKVIDTPFKILLLALYASILLVLIVPNLSIYYGIQRVYFTASIALAICFPLGIRLVAARLHIVPLALSATILILYALSTSGVTYLLFGIEKTLPIFITLP